MLVTCVCYSRTTDGAHALLLTQSATGLAAVYTEEVADGDSTSSIAEGLARTLAHLLGPTEEVASRFGAKLASGKGVHAIRLNQRTSLLLIPCRFETPGADSILRWVPARELVEPSAILPQLATQLSTLLTYTSAQTLLCRLATAASVAVPRTRHLSPPPPPPDKTVPRKLDTDLFLGEVDAAVNEPLLRMLGITLILVFEGAETNEASNVWDPHRATAVAKELGATLVVIPRDAVTVTALEGMSLLGECCDMLELGVSNGGALLAGDIDGCTQPGPAWVACALRASSALL